MTQKKIQDIDKGMVFDHLDLGKGADVLTVLKKSVWNNGFYPVMTGSFISERKGKKDIVKLHGPHLEEGSPVMNDLAVISPDSTVNWIEGERVVKKRKAWECIADFIETSLVECANHNCVSHDEAPPKFHVTSKNPLKLKCFYCTREFQRI